MKTKTLKPQSHQFKESALRGDILFGIGLHIIRSRYLPEFPPNFRSTLRYRKEIQEVHRSFTIPRLCPAKYLIDMLLSLIPVFFRNSASRVVFESRKALGGTSRRSQQLRTREAHRQEKQSGKHHGSWLLRLEGQYKQWLTAIINDPLAQVY